MTFLSNDRNTKSKINKLYAHLLDTDANYGNSFVQHQPVFFEFPIKSSIDNDLNF